MIAVRIAYLKYKILVNIFRYDIQQGDDLCTTLDSSVDVDHVDFCVDSFSLGRQ